MREYTIAEAEQRQEDGMQALAPRQQRRSLAGIIGRWWRKVTEKDSCRAHWRVPAGEDMGVFACDLEAAAELRALVSHGPDEAYLLSRRMATLGLAPDSVARLEPRVFCNLQRRCTLCDHHGRCAWDLGDDFADPAWQDWRDEWPSYCPNAATLRALSEMPWFQPAASLEAVPFKG
jgi:hypothetical protein